MRKERIFLILGIWIAVLPYLGFPYSWKNILFTLSGLLLVYYSYTMHKENKETETKPNDNYQNNDQNNYQNNQETNYSDVTKSF